MPFTLPNLTYAHNIRTIFDSMTMEIIMGNIMLRVNNLNNAIKETEWDSKPLKKFTNVSKLSPAVRNNGGHFNHSLFWNLVKQNGDELHRVNLEMQLFVILVLSIN